MSPKKKPKPRSTQGLKRPSHHIIVKGFGPEKAVRLRPCAGPVWGPKMTVTGNWVIVGPTVLGPRSPRTRSAKPVRRRRRGGGRDRTK